MYENPYSASFEARILCATPLELVALLYDGAIEAVQGARRHLADGKVMERSRSITKAVSILSELYQSLKRQPEDELSTRLAGLYDYMQRTLLDANFRQTDSGLAETESLLKTLRDAWMQISSPLPRTNAYSGDSAGFSAASSRAQRSGWQFTA
jgi:flagellar protein FliS